VRLEQRRDRLARVRHGAGPDPEQWVAAPHRQRCIPQLRAVAERRGVAEPRADERRLSSLDSGARASVTRISEVAEREAPLLLGYLLERGLVPGRGLEVLEVDAVGRTLQVRIGARDVTLSHETAGKIWVAPE